MPRITLCLVALAAALAACSEPAERAPVERAGGLRYALALAEYGEHLYCLQATGSLLKIAKSDGARTELSPVLDPYEAPAGSVPVIMVDGFSVAVTSDGAFFTTFNFENGVRTGIVWKVGLDGSNLTALARHPGQVLALTADETSVYVGRTPLQADSEGVVESSPHTGPPFTTLATRRSRPTSLVTVADTLYWLDAGVSPGSAMGGVLASVPKAGGTVRTLATQLRDPVELQQHDNSLFWLDRGSCTRSGNVCMSNFDGTIGELSLGGGWPDTLVHGRKVLAAFALAGDDLYFVDTDLYRMATRGLAPEPERFSQTLPNGTGSAVTNVVTDGSRLWWASTLADGRLLELQVLPVPTE